MTVIERERLKRPKCSSTRYPAERIIWRETPNSSNVKAIGWDSRRHMYVVYKDGIHVYMYDDVSRQRAVYAANALSVGAYVSRVIQRTFQAVRIP